MSKKYCIDIIDMQKWLRNALIIYTPVFLLALNQLQNWNFDIKIIYASIISITIDLVRRFLNDYTK